MRRRKKVTMKEVARLAGVSTQTVSRVINNRPDVSPETRNRVRGVIEEIGYSPNVLARSLSRGRTNTLGVVGYGLQYFGSNSVLTGIEQKVNELGYSLLLSLVDQFVPPRVDEILSGLLSRQVDGIIWAAPGRLQTSEWLVAKLEDLVVPVVFLNKGQEGSEEIAAMDNRSGGRLATGHLLEQGYRRIGIITGPPDWWEAQEREAGWREALTEAGLDDLDTLKVNGDWTAASGDVGLHTLYARSPDIEAVFASNDQMALGVLQAARRLGLRIPDDLGIVGFDDIPEAAYFFPSLTTIRQDAVALGALAVEKMVHFIQVQDSGEPYTTGVSWLRPRLIVRKSALKKAMPE